jgi:hypothetical protein
MFSSSIFTMNYSKNYCLKIPFVFHCSLEEQQLMILPYEMLTPAQQKQRRKIQGRKSQRKYMSGRKKKGGKEFQKLLAERSKAERRGQKLP